MYIHETGEFCEKEGFPLAQASA